MDSDKDCGGTLVLGMGNLLLADEGAGVHAARLLAERPLPEGVDVMEVGTALLDALDAMARAGRIVVVDAMKAGGSPGTVYRIPLEKCGRPGVIGSLHGFDITRVLALTGRRRAPEVVALGIEPERIEWSMSLSPAVDRALPFLVEAVLRECAATEGFS